VAELGAGGEGNAARRALLTGFVLGLGAVAGGPVAAQAVPEPPTLAVRELKEFARELRNGGFVL